MPPSWTRGQHSMVPPPANYMSWQFGRAPLYTSPSPQTPSPQTPSPQSTPFSSASPTPPVIGTNAFVTSDTPNSIPTNSIHANSVPVNNVPANSIPASGVHANSGAATPTTDTIIAKVSLKENTALPPIDRTSLISPQAVVDKYPKLLKASKLPMLSIKLAQEAYFGKMLMSFCTFRGIGSYHALPEAEVKKLKEFIKKLTLPGIVSTNVDFELLWKRCIESIGQSCKNLRKLRLSNLELK